MKRKRIILRKGAKTLKVDINGLSPGAQIPPMASDGCSVEVLVESPAGFYVGYYYEGDWYDSFSGEKLWKQFLPWRWYHLPKRGQQPVPEVFNLSAFAPLRET